MNNGERLFHLRISSVGDDLFFPPNKNAVKAGPTMEGVVYFLLFSYGRWVVLVYLSLTFKIPSPWRHSQIQLMEVWFCICVATVHCLWS